jgi:hypothetical protein
MQEEAARNSFDEARGYITAILEALEAQKAETGKLVGERAELRAALQEARPYVFNRAHSGRRTATWREETARDVLARVDDALSTSAVAEEGKR